MSSSVVHRALGRNLALAMAFLIAISTLALLPSTPASANSPNGGAILSNGLVEIGVNAEGHLNWLEDGTTASWSGTKTVGLRYVGHDTPFEATADGCTCEGWGVADALTDTWGGADDAFGIFNMASESFESTADSATAVALIPSAEAPVYRVTHHYSPSTNDYAFQVDVTIENVSDSPVDVRYLRSMDWDVQPTATNEVVTVVGGSAPIDWMSDNPFEEPNPLVARSSLVAPNSGDNWVDSGPADHGGVFSFDLGELEAGGEVSFQTYYGAAPDRATATSAIVELGFEAYSIGVANTATGIANVPQQPNSETGVPVTFFFGFTGVGGEVVAPPGYPAAPVVTAGVDDIDALIEWTAPDNGGSDITGYVVQVSLDEGDWETAATVDGETLAKLLEGLEPGSYRVRVAAINETGQGPWGSTTFVVAESTPEEPPSEPEEPEVPETPEEPEAPQGEGFKDTVGSQFAAEIQWMADNGISKGCNPPTNDHFCPDSFLIRGEVAAFLDRVFDLPATEVDHFSDDGHSEFQGSLNRTASAEVFRGCNPPANDIVCPDRVITRGELAAVIYRAFDLPDGGTSFDDTTGHVFEREAAALRGLGITNGCNPPENDEFCPDRPITRAEAAAFIYRANQSKG